MKRISPRPWIAAIAFLLFALPAPAADLLNVAPLGTATQSTELGGYPASNALDGNYGNFTHTNVPDANPTWQVDLGSEYSIEKIVLYNRGDGCCPERLRDITVSILAADGTTIVYESALLNPLNELFGPPTLEVDLVVDEGAAIDGQIVRVGRTNDPNSVDHDASVISLGEIEVLVDKASIPVAIATQPAGGRKYLGGCHVFSVGLFNAESAASITYEWYKDDVKLEGETSPRLIRGNLQPADAGSYKVVVKADATTLTSDAAVLVFAGQNLATTGVATQSTLAFDGVPERAIDGNTSGNWADATISHTDNFADGWWQVELFGNSTVDTVTLWNRLDCCGERLMNFRVSALDDQGTEVWGEDFFTDLLSYPSPSLECDLGGITCRTIKVTRLGADGTGLNYLSLAEVEVVGDGPLPPTDPHPNLARTCGSFASQSSTGGAYVAGLAVNGNLADFTHTVVGNNGLGPATWEIDLATDQDIALITLFNRTSCCGSRLRDITVSILDAAGDPVWTSELLNPENELGVFPLGPPQLGLSLMELEGAPVRGRIVRVTREPDPDLSGGGDGSNLDEGEVLSLGEVEIYAYPSDCPAAGDTHAEDLVIVGPDGSYPGLYTFTVAADDDNGDPIGYTFTIDNGIDPATVVGPQLENLYETRLAPGEWTISVSVDDDVVCIDEASDASVSRTLEVIDVENLALSGIATQSSEYVGVSFPAMNGIDGNYANITHTAIGNNGLGSPTWEVDLQSEQAIGRVVLYNRPDCCGSRLRDITVYILDGLGDVLWQSELLNPENELGLELLGPPVLTIDVEGQEPGGVVGQIVRVERTPDPDLSGTGGLGNDGEPDSLSLAEVEVYPVTGVVQDPRFHRGDANTDGQMNITDGIYVLNYLFLGGPTPTCLEAANANDDATLNITDGIYILNYLFLGGPTPPNPGPTEDACGPDPAASASDLGCDSYTHC